MKQSICASPHLQSDSILCKLVLSLRNQRASDITTIWTWHHHCREYHLEFPIAEGVQLLSTKYQKGMKQLYLHVHDTGVGMVPVHDGISRMSACMERNACRHTCRI